MRGKTAWYATSFVTFIVLVTPGALAAQESPVERLGWLVGCWTLRPATGTLIVERWMRPDTGMLLGSSRTTRDGRIVESETLRILTRDDGAVVLDVHPSGQAAASFTASLVSDTLVVFENPQHDFPQKIQYRRVGADSLRASIEGPRGGQVRTIAFPYARASCT